MEQTENSVFLVDGCKGGVGKSFFACGLIDHLLQAGHKVLLVDADTSNPEVWMTYKGLIPTATLDLDVPQGWIALVNSCEQYADHVVVVNTAARNQKGTESYGYTLYDSLEELNWGLVTYFVINPEIESLHLLKAYLQTLPHNPRVVLDVVKNEYFASTFDLYETSKVRHEVERRGGTAMRLPALAAEVANELRNKKMPISAALKSLPLGNRTVLRRWRNEFQLELGGSSLQAATLPAVGGVQPLRLHEVSASSAV